MTTPAKKAAAAPAKTAEAKPATNTADPASSPDPADVKDEREAQAKAAESADVKVGPEPGTDEFAKQYRDTLNQLAGSNPAVPAPEGTVEHEAYTPPAKGKK